MKILLCNKFYYPRGGDCIYTLNLEKMLSSRGHKAAVFAMDCNETFDTPWKSYFPSEVNFSSFSSKVKYACRCLGIGEVANLFSRLIDDFKPDVVHLNNIHSQLSPVIAAVAHNRGIKVVWTLHDYKLLCPRYDCQQNGKKPCELCFDSKFNVLKHKCMKNSFVASAVAYAEAVKWSRARLESYTDAFICPSLFMKKKMEQGGFNPEKLHYLCNAIDVSQCCRDEYSNRGNYFCYVGRMSREKGVVTLANVAAKLDYRLLVVGDGPLAGSLPESDNIKYLGRQDWKSVKRIMGGARFSIMPSECYDNNPLSVIESLCLGTPVLGARIGGIPELIQEGKSGLYFKSGDEEDLAKCIKIMFGMDYNYAELASEACARFSNESYFEQLMQLYES